MKSFTLFFIVTIIFCYSCADTTEKSVVESSTLPNHSFDTNGRDTINLVDQNGLKQGVWKPSPTNDLKETVIYRNDTIVK